MFKLWKYSTIVFVLQLVVGVVAYYMSDDLVVAFIFAAFAAFAVLAAAAFATLAGFAAFAAFATVIAAAAAGFVTVIATVTLAVIAIVATTAAAEEENDSFVPCFIAGLPLGIGTVAGGAILFARQYTKWKAV